MRGHSFRSYERPDLMAQAWRLRFEVFNSQLGWHIPTTDLLEYDLFDFDAVHYGILSNNQMVGYWRALRTDRPYLLEQAFGSLFPNYPIPKSARIWEISRLAIHPDAPNRRAIGKQLGAAFVAHGYSMNAASVIGITEPKFDAFLKRCGFCLSQLTEPVVVGESERGQVKALITECPINEQNLRVAGIDIPAAA